MGFCPEDEVFRFLRLVPLVEQAMVDSGIVLLAPWHIADSNDKKRACLNIISHLLDEIPYDSPPRDPVVIPPRDKRNGYRDPDHSHRYIPSRY